MEPEGVPPKSFWDSMFVAEDVKRSTRNMRYMSLGVAALGSKLGDHAAIISTIARETPMTLTPKSFRAILDHALDNKLIRKEHHDIMTRDANLAGMEKMDKDILNLPWSQYIVFDK